MRDGWCDESTSSERAQGMAYQADATFPLEPDEPLAARRPGAFLKASCSALARWCRLPGRAAAKVRGGFARPAERGGAAVEYLLVTSFATLLSIAALAYIGSLMKERLAALAARLGSSAEVPDFDLLSDGGAP